MDIDPANPRPEHDDVRALTRALAEEQRERRRAEERLDQRENEVEQLREFVGTLRADKERLQHRIDALLRAYFGRRSEKVDPAQLTLFVEETLSSVAEAIEDESKPSVEEEEEPDRPADRPQGKNGKKKQKKKGGLPDHLKRERTELDVPEEDRICEDCGRVCEHRIGEEISERMEFVPATVVVQQLVRPKYACRPCGSSVNIAPMPTQPIEKGIAGPGLLAKVLTDKYADHLPLYRQDGIFERFGLDISRSTLCGWVAKSAQLLEPVWGHMCKDVLGSAVLHTDDTVIPVLRPGKGQTGKARLWVYRGDESHPHTVFDYTRTRSRDGPARFLQGYKGHLQADAYAGYDSLYQSGDIVEVGCMAHVRRKFYDARSSSELEGCTALAYIQRLYRIEKIAADMDDDERRDMRERDAKPILADFHAWLKQAKDEVLPRSAIGEAITYALNQWEALNTYVEHGYLRIDNNLAENAIRPLVLGRKNYLFAGSDRGGRNAAIIYSLVESCRRNRVNCFDYLKDLLDRVSVHPASRIAELTPAAWKQRFESEITAKAEERV